MRQIIAILGLTGAFVACIAGAGRQAQPRVLDATLEMERVATALEHTRAVSSAMSDEIVRLVHQPWLDCSQVACRDWLERRNHEARLRLQTALIAAETRYGSTQIARAGD